MTEKRQNKGVLWLILIFAWLLSFSLIRDLGRVQGGFKRIAESERRLSEEEKKNLELKKKLKLVETAYFKEKTVREKLNMQRPGETVVVMEGLKVEEEELSMPEVEKKPNWKKWAFLWE